MKKNFIYYILWFEAFYTFEKEIPQLPKPTLTVGFIVPCNNKNKFIKIATSINYDKITQDLLPVGGILIPKKTKIKHQIIYNYEEK
jgi:hypothetical protein